MSADARAHISIAIDTHWYMAALSVFRVLEVKILW